MNPVPTAGEIGRSGLLVLRLSSLIIGVLGILIALALVNVDSILDSWWKLSSIFSGGMLGLFLLGFLSRKARNIDAAIGVVCGFLVIAWISLGNSGIHEYLAIVFGVVVFIVSGFEHCVANMFYFAVAGQLSGQAFTFLAVNTLGNAVGGVFMPLLLAACKKLA